MHGSNAGLAQLVRAPALQAGGHRFESYVLHHFFVLKTCNQVLKYIIIILEMKKSSFLTSGAQLG